jgi:hypothetical protein
MERWSPRYESIYHALNSCTCVNLVSLHNTVPVCALAYSVCVCVCVCVPISEYYDFMFAIIIPYSLGSIQASLSLNCSLLIR